jgi:hypothetical protein
MTTATQIPVSQPTSPAAREGIFRFEALIAIMLIVFLAVIAYGVLSPWTGFYWDDYPFLWVMNSEGTEGLIQSAATDRPANAIPYLIAYAVAGNNPLAWQLLGLALRISASVAFLWMVRSIWVNKPLITLSMAALFTVYPGFLQQPNALIYTVHLLTLLLIAVSIGCTVHAVRAAARTRFIVFTLIGVVTAAAYIFLLEFFIGSEILRLAVIGIVAQQNRLKLRQWGSFVLRHGLPYIVVLIGFLVWRLFFFTSERSATDVAELAAQYQASPLSQLIRIPMVLIGDLFETLFAAWFAPANDRLSDLSIPSLGLTIAAGVAAAAAFLVAYQWIRRRSRGTATPDDAAVQGWEFPTFLLIGAALVACLLPVIVSNRQVVLLTASNRYTLPAMMSVCILVVLVFQWIRPVLRLSLVAVLVAVSVGTHLANANLFRAEWQMNRELWWQLYWRAPDIAPGTLVIAALPEDRLWVQTHYSVWAPLNLIYTSDAEEDNLIAGQVLVEAAPDKLREGDLVEQGGVRAISFDVDYQAALLFALESDAACLRVIDGDRMELPAGLSARLRSVAPYSHVNRILAAGDTNPSLLSDIFGAEPEPTWCYYLQQAERARQFGEWERIAELYAELQEEGFAPDDAGEWLPFVEGFIQLGDAAQVTQILEAADSDIDDSFVIREQYCALFARVRSAENVEAPLEEVLNSAETRWECQS